MTELKPCPFCGAAASAWEWNGGARVDCSKWRADAYSVYTHYVGIGARTMEEAIELWNRRAEQPPAQPEQRWIPCSERLPSFDFTDVLVCMHDVRHGCEDEYYIASAYVVRGHWKMTLNVDTSDLEIVAWMPLPAPYRPEGDEKHGTPRSV